MLTEIQRMNLAGSVERAQATRFRKQSGTAEGVAFTADYLHELAREGRIFTASPGAALNTTSLGAAATSFTATTPDFTLEVPSGTTCIPLRIHLTQAGTVAGGAITAIVGIQGAIERSSGGTAFANIKSTRTDAQGPAVTCTPYVAPTVAADTVGVAIYRTILTQSVTTARTVTNADLDLTFGVDLPFCYLVGVSALKIYTFAGTTAPTWFPSLTWAEIPSTDLTN